MFYPHLENLNKLCNTINLYSSNKISLDTLESFFDKFTSLVPNEDFLKIMKFGLEIGLFIKKGNLYSLSELGQKFVKLGNNKSILITNKQKAFFRDDIFFKNKKLKKELKEFFDKFEEDDYLGTFVYYRTLSEKSDFFQLAIFLNNLGIINSVNNTFILEKDFLEQISIILATRKNISYNSLDFIRELKSIQGAEAEIYVLDFEKKRLENLGRFDLAENVKRIGHINTHAGYDIKSFNGLKNDIEYNRFIEVKSSCAEIECFYLTANELNKARKLKNKYWIYFLRDFNKEKITNKMRMIQNPYSKVYKGKKYRKEPVVYFFERI